MSGPVATKKNIFTKPKKAFSGRQSYIVPLFTEECMPLCHNCGTPCPDCRTQLDVPHPKEMLTATAILDWDKRDKTREDSREEQEEPSSEEPSSAEESLSLKMRLRSRKS